MNVQELVGNKKYQIEIPLSYNGYKKGILSPKTYRTYCQRMTLINEHIGYVKVRNITAKILD